MSDFDFDFEPQKPTTNMQQILDKHDKESIDWDNFDVPNNQQNSASLSHSQFFNKSQKSPSQLSQKKDFEDSRDIMEISMFMQNQGRSFKFQKNDLRDFPKPNERYNRLQNLLQNAKKNSLDQFYKNIQRQNKSYNDQPEKFANYKEFKDFVKDIKAKKRQKQSQFAQKEALNPFATVNSNKIFGTSDSKKIQAIPQQKKPVQKPQSQYNFQKKPTLPQTIPQQTKNKGIGHLLPQQYQKQDFFEQEPIQQKVTPAQRFNNFYQGQKLPQKAAQHNKEEDAFQFFQTNTKKVTDRSEKQAKVVLQPIRQEKHNSFQRTFQQEKLDNLFKNYQSMRKNFQELMGELKSTNEGQEKLVTELRKLKDERIQNQINEEKIARRQRKQRQNLEKNKKLDSIKDQITKIKSNDKDILFTQINKKIEQLQSVVRSALQQINQQKETKITPKIINYFCEHEKRIQNIDQQFEKGLQQFDPQAYKQPKQIYNENNQNHQRSIQFQNENKNLQVSSRKNLVQSPSQKYVKKQQASSHKQSQSRSRNNNHSREASVAQSKFREISHQNLFSPLDLQLQGNYDNYQPSYSMAQDQYCPAQFAQQFFPRQLQSSNKNLRNCLIQKSSVVYQSFDFHVSARFSVVDDQMHPILVAMRIGNKCSIDLYDVHVITYGPQGPGISTDPSTIFQQEVKRNSSFSFQVSLDKTCIQDNGFSIQIWYKTDSMPKKKINFKVPLPLIQLIRPQFIYEQKFINDWQTLTNQQFIRPKILDSTYLRSHEDLKLILPFIDISQQNNDCFSYGLSFRYPKCENLFYLKITCFVSGRALIQLRSQKPGDKKVKQEMLNVLNFIFYSHI